MKIEREHLLDALTKVKPGLSNAGVVEQATNFAFINGTVVTYNEELCIIHPLPDFDFEGAIKAEELYNFLKKVKAKEITVEKEGDEIIIEAGRAKSGFAVKTEITMPIEEVQGDHNWWKLPRNFLEGLKLAIPCVSKDAQNFKINCVHLTQKLLEATDNQRAFRFKLSKKLPLKSALIPATLLKEVIRLQPVEVAQSTGWVHFKNAEDVIISCRVLEDSYVALDRIFERERDGILFSFPEKTIDILDLAKVFTTAQKKETNEEHVSISFKDKTLLIAAESETSWFKERLPVKDFKGGEFEFAITPYLLSDILKQTNMCIISDYTLTFSNDTWTYISSLAF